MSQARGKKTLWKTVEWAAKIADQTGIDYDDLELESDEELEEADYDDPLDDYEVPATRGKSGRSSWQMDLDSRSDESRRDQPRERSRQDRRDLKQTEQAEADAEIRIRPDAMRDALTKAAAAQNTRVIAVRHAAPAVPPAVQFLTETYQALDAVISNQIAAMDVTDLARVQKQVDAFNQRLDALDKMFAAYPNADRAAVWANNSRNKAAKPSLDKLVRAIQANPPDEAGYAAASKELAPLYAPVAAAEQARWEFLAAYGKLDYKRCLTMANAKETADLSKQKAAIDKQRSLDTQRGYQAAAKLVPGLARTIDAVAKAYNDRLVKKPQFENQFKTDKAACTASLSALNGWPSPKKDDWKRERAEIVKQLDTLLSVAPKDLDVSKSEDQLAALRHIIERMNEQADDNRRKEQLRLETANAAADKAEYANFKVNDHTTWNMQALVDDKIPLASVLVVNASDRAKLAEITMGRLGEGTCQTGRAYHCHMINDGSGGVSFAYNHLGGQRVQPVIYDYATHRVDDKYDWELGGGRKNPSSAPLPSWIKARRPPAS